MEAIIETCRLSCRSGRHYLLSTGASLGPMAAVRRRCYPLLLGLSSRLAEQCGFLANRSDRIIFWLAADVLAGSAVPFLISIIIWKQP